MAVISFINWFEKLFSKKPVMENFVKFSENFLGHRLFLETLEFKRIIL